MTAWTNITAGEIDTDSPVTQPLMTALRDNVLAAAEGATGAPVEAAGWHPYNQVEYGDGADGLIYDNSVDGNVSAVETPDFEDGWEYRVVALNLTAVSTYWKIEGYLETSAYWGEYCRHVTSTDCSFVADFYLPRKSETVHVIGGGVTNGYIENATSQKIEKARVNPNSTNITGGRIYLHRRRADG